MKKNIFGKNTIVANWFEALKIIGRYTGTSSRHIKPHDSSEIMLKGFKFNASELRQIVNQEGTEEVYFAIGYHDEVIASEDNEIGYTLVMLGVDSENRLMNNDGDLIFDYCNPCPPKCPAY